MVTSILVLHKEECPNPAYQTGNQVGTKCAKIIYNVKHTVYA